jgi:hypothetical protein
MFGWLKSWFSSDSETGIERDFGTSSGCSINPASGLPMIGDDCTGIDVAGNPYGTDLQDSWTDSGLSDWNSISEDWSSSFSDDWSSSSSDDWSSFSDGFGSSDW